MKTARIVCVFALTIGACSNQKSPTAPTDLKASLSTAFDAFTIPSGSACSISVSQHGQVVLERGRGQVAPGLAASGDSLFRIASLTKPITATAILMSEKAGRLQISDKINKYLPFPEPAPTIDELIKHVPGLPNYTDTFTYQSERFFPTTVEKLVSLIQPWDGVKRYQYSNSHAVLTGTALQLVNGIPYQAVVQRDIFGPAGMTRSSYEAPSAAEAFQTPSPTHTSWVLFGGGITSTAADMNRFNQALLSNSFGIGAVESFDRSAQGVTSFGMGSGNFNGDLGFTHAGGLDNYSSYTVLFPADRASLVLLCNFNNGNPSSLSNFVMSLRTLMLASK